ncbi:hypothetical protein LOTGIDRAFT_116779 [Lottia gigantea]|uniref:G-protein coupled receptors family 1 profile domain-containing protein n=1 Tax=Lottia gigantea TaxID=225164 RepID=V4AFT9_LOTGI|nr:hypothetical protein LOTGIDRAFT_116779 [Lottia gigantea]ESO95767.1 hypothetical protein LOTGIDRAFT_116779 [Lottia gigantea]
MCHAEDLLFVSLNGFCVTKQEFALNLCLAVVGMFIILINLLAVVTLIKHTDMEEPTNYFIANLAIADTFIGIFLIYDVFYNILQFKFYIECVLRVGLFISVNIASVFNLTTLTLDRYIKVTKPYKYLAFFSPRKVKVAEALIWIASIVCGMLPFFGWSTLDIFEICNFFGIMSWTYLLFILSVFSIPSCFIVFAYIHFLMLANKQREAISSQMSSFRGAGNSRRERRALKSFKTAFIIVGAYFLCWGPVVIVSDIEKSMAISPNVVFVYLLGIGVFNSILNPIIYASKISVFRKKLHRMFCVSRIQEFKRNSIRSLSNAFRTSVAQVNRGSNASNESGRSYGSTQDETRVTTMNSGDNGNHIIYVKPHEESEEQENDRRLSDVQC